MNLFKKILKKYRYIYLLSVVISVIVSLLSVLFSMKLGEIIDVINDKNANLILKIEICLIIIIAIILIGLINSKIISRYIFKINTELKKGIYKNFYDNNLSVYNEKEEGIYFNIFTRDIDLLNENYLIPRLKIIEYLFDSIFSTTAIFFISWKLALSFIVISILNILFSGLPSKYMIKKTNNFSKTNNNYLSKIKNYISGFEQIKLLILGQSFFERTFKIDKEFENSRADYFFSKGVSKSFANLLALLSHMLCLSIGIYFTINGDISIGMLIASIQLLNSVFQPIAKISEYKNLMKTCNEIIERINEKLINKEESLESIKGEIEEIRLDNINLSFKEKTIFENYSQKFERNKKYAIVGESGRGKSTLIKLILKYYKNEMYSGNVLINGNKIENIKDNSIYKKIGFIEKNNFLINENIKNNILLGRNDDNKIEKISEILAIKNLNKEIIDNNLSEGEKQRIDIARFLISDYDVMIFDEPTSNLDPNTSDRIYDYIFNLQNKIIIVITHNRDNKLLEKFDEIIRL